MPHRFVDAYDRRAEQLVGGASRLPSAGSAKSSCMKVPFWLSIVGQVRCDVRSIKSSKPQLTTTSNVASYSIFRESTTCTQRGSHETATSLIAFGKSTISLVTTIA